MYVPLCDVDLGKASAGKHGEVFIQRRVFARLSDELQLVHHFALIPNNIL
jgi:hypothetical protein